MEPHGGQPLITTGAPLGESRGVMIMVHGRNAAPENILDLVPHLDRPEFSYVAPSAANRTWYPFSFLVDSARNEPGLSSGLQVLADLVRDLVARGYRKEQIALLGFSQGACLTAEFCVRHADRYGGVFVLSGGLIGPPGTTWNYPGSFGGTPVFFGCSDVDSHIPRERVDESANIFSRMGAVVTKRLYPGMGHFVSEDELSVVNAAMKKMLGDQPGIRPQTAGV